MKLDSGHFIAVVGGACAGSEAAFQLADRGAYVAVFEQNSLPYGKIEGGLPKWHVKLRDKEEAKIDAKLNHPRVFYVPNVRLGVDVQAQELMEEWGFSLMLLASGAWRDRPFPVAGIEAYQNRGFYYQNAFVDWFNHSHEAAYSGQTYDIHDGALVVGGGLASLDVAKILMLETTARALADRGIEVNILQLEQKGIPKVLEEHGLTFPDLGLKGCTLVYRRRMEDMPLKSLPAGDLDEAQLAKIQEVRKRILTNAMEKYCFRFQGLSRPVEILDKEGRLTGLVFERTRVENGRVVPVADSRFTMETPLVISSIGSIPEALPGIPCQGELFHVDDAETGRLGGCERIFALGNAVTGRGNIRESEKHAREVARHIAEDVLHLDGDVDNQPWRLTADQNRVLAERLIQLQASVGYDGDYTAWVARHQPVRLESLVGE